jgi:hypothetical protein
MSQYDQAFKEPEIKPGPTYSHWDTIPVIITVDNYSGDLDEILNPDKYTEAMKSKVTFNFVGDEIRGIGCGVLRDVVSIELISAMVPVNNAEIFMCLKVNNYSKIKSNNALLKDSFCLLYNENPSLNDYCSLTKRSAGKSDDHFTYYFPEPTKISTLDIEFVSPTGDAIIFAEMDNSNPPKPAVDANENPIHTYYMLTFEIRMLNSAPKPEARFRNGVAGGKGSPWQ